MLVCGVCVSGLALPSYAVVGAKQEFVEEFPLSDAGKERLYALSGAADRPRATLFLNAKEAATFRKITPAMPMLDIFRTVGLPDADIGSGLHVFVYHLRDGGKMLIGTADVKRLLCLDYVTRDGKAERWVEGTPPP